MPSKCRGNFRLNHSGARCNYYIVLPMCSVSFALSSGEMQVHLMQWFLFKWYENETLLLQFWMHLMCEHFEFVMILFRAGSKESCNLAGIRCHLWIVRSKWEKITFDFNKLLLHLLVGPKTFIFSDKYWLQPIPNMMQNNSDYQKKMRTI